MKNSEFPTLSKQRLLILVFNPLTGYKANTLISTTSSIFAITEMSKYLNRGKLVLFFDDAAYDKMSQEVGYSYPAVEEHEKTITYDQALKYCISFI